MTRTRRTLAHATLQGIRPWVGEQHGLDSDKVHRIVEHVREIGQWSLPPVLVIESEGNGATVLDGHHRCAAARVLEETRIPAHVITVADYCRVLERHFDGVAPSRLCDLDEYIRVEGKPYRREDDGHV